MYIYKVIVLNDRATYTFQYYKDCKSIPKNTVLQHLSLEPSNIRFHLHPTLSESTYESKNMHLPTHKLQFRQKSTTATSEAVAPQAATPVPHPLHQAKPHLSFNIKNKYNVQYSVKALQNGSKWTDKAALALQKHGDHGSSKHTVERQIHLTTVPTQKGEQSTEVLTEIIVHKQREVDVEPDVTKGVEMNNTGIRRETVVYKEPEFEENSGTIREAKVDDNAEANSVPENTVESLKHNMAASIDRSFYGAGETASLIETHELHGYKSGEEMEKLTERLHHDTENEQEYLETSEEETEHSDDEDSIDDIDDEADESELDETKQEVVIAPSSQE